MCGKTIHLWSYFTVPSVAIETRYIQSTDGYITNKHIQVVFVVTCVIFSGWFDFIAFIALIVVSVNPEFNVT